MQKPVLVRAGIAAGRRRLVVLATLLLLGPLGASVAPAQEGAPSGG